MKRIGVCQSLAILLVGLVNTAFYVFRSDWFAWFYPCKELPFKEIALNHPDFMMIAILKLSKYYAPELAAWLLVLTFSRKLSTLILLIELALLRLLIISVLIGTFLISNNQAILTMIPVFMNQLLVFIILPLVIGQSMTSQK